MICVAYFDVDGRITSVAKGDAEVFGNKPWCIEITEAQLPTIEKTHCVDVPTRALKLGAMVDPSPPTVADVRARRDFLLAGAGLQLSEYLLADSYPELTPSRKAIKVDALVIYRQSLRDITTQLDLANITWPTPPA